ncbi:MAG: hypothetical protein J6386_09560 [Candidatus Synoicihabitans palmerolidicus]|nr:hypothetical protein [Candidatus Synoicihabitans palmerolidicus]
MKLIHKAVGDEIALQSWLRPALTTVGPNKDYGQFREQLDAVDRVLRASHLASMAMDFARVGFESVDAGQLRRRLEFARKALRVNVLRMLLGNMPFRQLSRTIASSDLLADFFGVRTIEGIKGVPKSVLERASQCFTAEPVRWMGQVFIEMVAEADRAAELGRAEPQSMETCLVDSTCLSTNIHFPVDWVLLRDVSRTLLKAVILIRRAGMRARMPAEPEVFARQMNRLCIEMTHTRRRANAKRARKQVLVRGKASGELEFGNTAMISENATGLINDWQMYQQAAPAEWRQLSESFDRQNQFDVSTPITAAGTDRGFATTRMRQILAAARIYDATCPRDPQELKQRMTEPKFIQLQRRRASTEARIAILKQRQGKRLRAKGFMHRYFTVAWSVLGHNLWLIARLLADEPPLAQAA